MSALACLLIWWVAGVLVIAWAIVQDEDLTVGLLPLCLCGGVLWPVILCLAWSYHQGGAKNVLIRKRGK